MRMDSEGVDAAGGRIQGTCLPVGSAVALSAPLTKLKRFDRNTPIVRCAALPRHGRPSEQVGGLRQILG